MARHAEQRTKNRPLELLPVFDGGPDETAIRGPVLTQGGHRPVDRPLEDYSRAVVQRMRERRGRVNELRQRYSSKERRAGDEGINRRARVVNEAGQRQLGRAHPAADRVVCFEHENGSASPRERDRGREPVRPGSDHDGL
jgi:hypothetical protein